MTNQPTNTRPKVRPNTQAFWLMVLPALLVLLAVGLYPLISSFVMSLSEQDIVGPSEFVGLENYLAFGSDPRFWNALANSLRFWVFAVGTEMLLGLALALAIPRTGWWNRLVAPFMLPMLIAPVVVAVVWLMLYHPTIGLLNHILRSLVAIAVPPAWLTDINLALPSLIVVDIWQWMPFMFILFRAAISAVPKDPEEAALVDGASRFQVFRYVTLPHIYGAILVAVLIRSIDVLKVFDVPYVMTGGGPGTITETLGIYTYRTAFEKFDLGYAAALSYVQLVLVLVVALPYVVQLQRRQDIN